MRMMRQERESKEKENEGCERGRGTGEALRTGEGEIAP